MLRKAYPHGPQTQGRCCQVQISVRMFRHWAVLSFATAWRRLVVSMLRVVSAGHRSEGRLLRHLHLRAMHPLLQVPGTPPVPQGNNNTANNHPRKGAAGRMACDLPRLRLRGPRLSPVRLLARSEGLGWLGQRRRRRQTTGTEPRRRRYQCSRGLALHACEYTTRSYEDTQILLRNALSLSSKFHAATQVRRAQRPMQSRTRK